MGNPPSTLPPPASTMYTDSKWKRRQSCRKILLWLFLIAIAIAIAIAIRRSSRSRTHFECVVCCRRSEQEWVEAAPGGRFSCRWAWLTWIGWGSFLSYFLLVFKVVKIDGPSAIASSLCGLSFLKRIFGIKLDRHDEWATDLRYPLCDLIEISEICLYSKHLSIC